MTAAGRRCQMAMFNAWSTSSVCKMVLHRPAHDPPAVDIHHHRQIQEAGPRRDVGDVRHLEPIGRAGREGALHEVRHRPGIAVPSRGSETAPAGDSHNTMELHQPSHPLVIHRPPWSNYLPGAADVRQGQGWSVNR